MYKHKCPKHNTWMKTNKYHKERGPQCEQCNMEADKRKKEYEQLGGSNKPPVVIRKV